MQLSKRMTMLANLVPKGSRLADIGTDHGYLPIALIQSGQIPGAIAMDINSGPLKRAKQHIEEAGLSSYIETRMSDGFDKLEPGEADTILIAGMGGPLMADILEKKKAVAQKAKTLILQPQSDFFGFRDYLCRNGYVLEQETMVEEDGKFYIAMVCHKGEPYNLSSKEKYFGPLLLKDPSGVFLEYLQRELQICEPIVLHLSEQLKQDKTQENGRLRLEELNRYTEYIKEILQTVNQSGSSRKRSEMRNNMTLQQILEELESRFWPEYAQSWDNSGLIVGDRAREIKKVFLALDASNEVISQAQTAGADLIVTHHPMIFSSIKKVNSDDFLGRKILTLAGSHIACYAMHTNFDVLGMADYLADFIQLQDRQVLELVTPVPGGKHIKEDAKIMDRPQGIGRYGSFASTMTLAQCAKWVKEQLHLPYVLVSGEPERKIHKAAVSSGSGKSMVGPSLAAGVDVLITGDMDHHTVLDAADQGLCVIDAGHYGTEYLFMEYMKGWFKDHLPQLQIETASVKPPMYVV